MAGVMESLKAGGPIGIAIFILAFVGNILNWIAFSTASWARSFTVAASAGDAYRGYGLWRRCDYGTGLVIACVNLDGTNVVYYGAVQALVSVGFLGMNVMCLIIFLKMFTSMCSSVGDIDKVNGIQAIVTGIIYLIGIIIYGVELGDGDLTYTGGGVDRNGDLGYSFVFAILAMIIEIVCGVLLLVMGIKGGSK